jgi:hypothetical protein
MIIEGAILGTIFALGFLFFIRWMNGQKDQPTGSGPNAPVSVLAYCNDDQVKPCVVSFGTDANDQMLVNILLPDLTFPNFYLKIIRSESESLYECQRVRQAINNAYCTGEKTPPGESLHLKLIATKDDTLLAEGDLSIIGLAYPTLEITIPTAEETPTLSTMPVTETPLSPFLLPTQTATQPSYPGPSYPNPDYP